MASDQANIWLDCDTGHDDAYALLLAAHHPKVNLIGVSTVHGNSSLDHTTQNTCAVLEALGRTDVPVIRGLAKPLQREAIHAPQYHGDSGLDGVTLLPTPRRYQVDSVPTGVDPIYDLLKAQSDHSVWLVATGPLTNVAQLLTAHPDIECKLRGVSIMGGAIGDGFTNAPMHRADGPGNWTQWAEFNIFCDPEAAQLVLQHEALSKLTVLAPLDLTHLCRADDEVFAKLFPAGQRLSKLRRMMEEVMVYFRNSYGKFSRGMKHGPPLHDAVAVFTVIDIMSNVVDGSDARYSVNVTTSGVQDGRTVAQPLEGGSKGILIPRAIRLDKFWLEIEQCLNAADDEMAILNTISMRE